MKESQKIFEHAEQKFEEAKTAWKNKQKDLAEENYRLAGYGMMKAYLVSEGVMHMDNDNSIHDAFQKIWNKDSVFFDRYAHELNYFDHFNNKRGYFKDHPELSTQLKNDFNKLHGKLSKIALKAIKENPEDKFVAPDDIVDFIGDIGNIMTKSTQEVKQEKEENSEKPEEKKPEKKSFLKSIFGNITVDIEVNGKKKK